MITIKIGGSVVDDLHPSVIADIKKIAEQEGVILVHGGGKEVTKVTKQLGKEPKFVVSPSGVKSRYTDLEKKAESLEQLGRYEEAIKCIDGAISSAIENGSYYEVGDCYEKKTELLNRLGRHGEALECIDEGIEKVNSAQEKESDFQTWELDEVLFYHLLPHKAKSLKQLGRYEEALECCEKGITMNSRSQFSDAKDFWNTKMESLEQLGRYEEAEKCSDKADPIPFYKKRNPRQKTLFWR